MAAGSGCAEMCADQAHLGASRNSRRFSRAESKVSSGTPRPPHFDRDTTALRSTTSPDDCETRIFLERPFKIGIHEPDRLHGSRDRASAAELVDRLWKGAPSLLVIVEPHDEPPSGNENLQNFAKNGFQIVPEVDRMDCVHGVERLVGKWQSPRVGACQAQLPFAVSGTVSGLGPPNHERREVDSPQGPGSDPLEHAVEGSARTESDLQNVFPGTGIESFDGGIVGGGGLALHDRRDGTTQQSAGAPRLPSDEARSAHSI